LQDTELKRIQLLDRLYDFRPRRASDLADVSTLIGPAPGEHDDWLGILHDLADHGAIMLTSSMSFDGTRARLLDAGRAEVERRRERRQDRVARTEAARRAVLEWLAEHPGSERLTPICTDPAYFFEGAGLQPADLGAALNQLHQQGLVTGTRTGEASLMNAALTARGRSLLEQGEPVSSYHQTNGTTNNIHFNGPVSGNVAWSNQAVTQTATTTGTPHDELMLLVRAITQAVPTLDLPRPDADAVASNAATLADELRRERPDRNLVATILGRSIATLGRQGSGALAIVLGAYARHLAQQMGLPVD
jgi:hypothetical protein